MNSPALVLSRPSLLLAILCASCFALSVTARAGLNYNTPDSIYSQDFNSLPIDAPSSANIQTVYTNGWADDTVTVAFDHISLPGWYLYHPIAPSSEGGSNGHQRLRFGVGGNVGGFWAFSNTDATNPEKAMGSIGSTTVAANGDTMRIALRLVNNTGVALTKFTVTYDGEQWRDGQSTSPETMSFGYALGAGPTDWTNATFMNVASLSFTSPVFAGTGTSGTAVDGNVAGRIADITGTVDGIDWEPGTELWLQWSDPQLASLADDGLAIDNVRFVASVPEPSSFAFAGMAMAAILIFRRRK